MVILNLEIEQGMQSWVSMGAQLYWLPSWGYEEKLRVEGCWSYCVDVFGILMLSKQISELDMTCLERKHSSMMGFYFKIISIFHWCKQASMHCSKCLEVRGHTSGSHFSSPWFLGTEVRVSRQKQALWLTWIIALDRSEDLCVFSGLRKQSRKRKCLASKATSMRSLKGYVLDCKSKLEVPTSCIYLWNHLALLNLFHIWKFVQCLRIREQKHSMYSHTVCEAEKHSLSLTPFLFVWEFS